MNEILVVIDGIPYRIHDERGFVLRFSAKDEWTVYFRDKLIGGSLISKEFELKIDGKQVVGGQPSLLKMLRARLQ